VLPYKTPSYVVADLGLRYTWSIVKLPLTFRAYVKNLTNNAYWDGVDVTDNPYGEDEPEEHHKWESGWRAARKHDYDESEG